ncbi:MAG: hypothetical protein ACE5EE_09670 [Fidelibacterota bacterium]
MRKQLLLTAIVLLKIRPITAANYTECALEGVVTDLDLSKTHVADIHYFENIRDQYHSCKLLGDKVYTSDELQTE